jgi:hypothetical protein
VSDGAALAQITPEQQRVRVQVDDRARRVQGPRRRRHLGKLDRLHAIDEALEMPAGKGPEERDRRDEGCTCHAKAAFAQG